MAHADACRAVPSKVVVASMQIGSVDRSGTLQPRPVVLFSSVSRHYVKEY